MNKQITFLSALLIFSTACNFQKVEKAEVEEETTTTKTIYITEPGDIDDGSGGTGGGTTCYGNTSDGEGANTLAEIIHHEILLSGGTSWHPGMSAQDFPWMQTEHPAAYNANEAGPAPDLYSGALFFNTDSILKVRFYIKPEPPIAGNTQTCWKRKLNQVQDAYTYKKLYFNVSLRDVICNDASIPQANQTIQNCSHALSLGPNYQTRTVGPVDINSCSEIIDYSANRNLTSLASIVTVHNMRSDSGCQYFTEGGQPYYEYYCPAKKDIKIGSCWNMTMQVVTNYTKDFR